MSPQRNKSNEASTNKPRNHIVKDATSPYTFTYTQYGQNKSITVNQTPDDDTWPGGALWDIGALLAKALVMVNKPPPSSSSSSGKKEAFVPRLRSPGIWPASWKDCTILELGCGVGLTGLVGAQLGAKLTLLTDLDVVVEKVTKPNVELNKKEFGMGQKVLAMPLCWDNEDDEAACRKILESCSQTKKGGSTRKLKKKGKGQTKPNEGDSIISSDPSIILIGDVAYQHKPGAPSHFDILMSTLLKFATTRETVVMFGTRMRMPASSDLLDMFREHFDEVIEPVQAHEIDHSFHSSSLGRNSLITLHVFKRKVEK
jgi:predicted nicotinamide N-methyase